MADQRQPSDNDTDSTNHTAVDRYTGPGEEEGEPKPLSVTSTRQSRGNQSFLHNASQYVPPLEASDFPLTVEDTNAGVDAAEFIAEREKGYIEEPDGTKLVTFGPNDPANPRNWSKAYKWYVTCIIALVCFGVAFASAAVTGDLTGVSETFHVSMEVSILTVTVFVIGFGVGPLCFAPLSEILGRRPVYASTLLVALVFIIPCAVAKNIGTLIVCRLIDGIAFSAPMCLVGGSLADIWDNDERGPAMAFFSAAPFIGPGVGPIVGGFVGETVGWRWIYWVLLIFMGVVYLLCLTVPETFAPIILTKRAKKMRKETGDNSFMTETERNPRSIKELAKISLVRPMELLVRELIVLLISIYMSIIYGLLYMFFFAYPVIFGEGKGYSDGIIGLMFIPLILGVLASAMIAPFINSHYLKLAKKHGGNPPAEVRLIPMMVTCWLPPIGLFIFAWTSYPHVHWIGPCIAGFPCGLGFCVLYNAANNYIVDTYQHYAASALAAKTFLRSMWGACVPLFTIQMYHRLGYEWAGSLLAFISLACCVIPYLFYIYGARIRTHSKFAYSPEDEAEEVLHREKTTQSAEV